MIALIRLVTFCNSETYAYHLRLAGVINHEIGPRIITPC